MEYKMRFFLLAAFLIFPITLHAQEANSSISEKRVQNGLLNYTFLYNCAQHNLINRKPTDISEMFFSDKRYSLITNIPENEILEAQKKLIPITEHYIQSRVGYRLCVNLYRDVNRSGFFDG